MSSELEEELELEKLQASERKKVQQATELEQKTTVDDLTRGIVNYQYLGLDFEKAKDNHMK